MENQAAELNMAHAKINWLHLYEWNDLLILDIEMGLLNNVLETNLWFAAFKATGSSLLRCITFRSPSPYYSLVLLVCVSDSSLYQCLHQSSLLLTQNCVIHTDLEAARAAEQSAEWGKVPNCVKFSRICLVYGFLLRGEKRKCCGGETRTKGDLFRPRPEFQLL